MRSFFATLSPQIIPIILGGVYVPPALSTISIIDNLFWNNADVQTNPDYYFACAANRAEHAAMGGENTG